jgi:lipopolysaccharide/colanic/teichoic acid biosynthesis glycosyltransferase
MVTRAPAENMGQNQTGDWAEYVLSIQPQRLWYERKRPSPLLSNAVYLALKRGVDLVVAILVMPLALLIVSLCCVAIRLDTPGPPMFRQTRTGLGGRRFRMFKLRTMVKNAEELKAQYTHLNELSYPDFKIRDDPRVTRVGKFLRRSSLDELPQIVNVLLGDMTLVGPRPTSFSATKYSLWHTARLQTKPGITGLSQVSGRNQLDFNDRLRLDIAYLNHQSLWLDVRILFRTAVKVFTGHGAY